MSWHDAPRLQKLTSAQHGGKRGAHLWGVDYKGTLYSIYQQTKGGDWSKWAGPDWAGPGFPKQVYELAAAQGKDGRITLLTLDVKRRLKYVTQDEPDGNWTGWHDLDWNGAPENFLTKLTAVQRGIKEPGVELWAITNDGEVHSSHQWLKEARWFQGWYVWPNPQDTRFIELAAARQHNNLVGLWGIDSNLRLWFMQETSSDSPTPPTGWGSWQGPNWGNTPKLRNIAAVRGAEGVILFGITDEYRLIQNWQDSRGNWNGWSPHANWLGAPHCNELTACGQNNNCSQIWVVTLTGKLSSLAQAAPACNWKTPWSDLDDK